MTMLNVLKLSVVILSVLSLESINMLNIVMLSGIMQRLIHFHPSIKFACKSRAYQSGRHPNGRFLD